jgi:Arc/MetJ family transcription regulator
MRTTITLDPDVAALVQRVMRERGLTFKEAVNTALRKALVGGTTEYARTPEIAMGHPTIPLDHALRIAAELEDAEIRRKLSTGQ